MPKAIAKQRGYYPLSEGGPYRIVEEGEVFDLVGKLTKAKWFTVLDEPKVGKKGESDKKDETPLA